MPKNRLSCDFYSVQKKQWRTSLFLLCMMFLFHFLFCSLIAAVGVGIYGFFVRAYLERAVSEMVYLRATFYVFLASGVIALLHFYDAKRSGARRLSFRTVSE